MNRGRDLEQILTQYTTFVKPAFEEFCLPVSFILIVCLFPIVLFCLSLKIFILSQTKKYVDVIIPRGVDNMGKCIFVGKRRFSESSSSMNDLQIICLSPVAINLIVQHIQDILNGDICKWQRGAINGRNLKRAISEQSDLQNGAANPPGKRVLLEPSCRPH